MVIPVTIKSNVSGRVVRAAVTPRVLLDTLDEDELVQRLTACECQPIGETYVIDCNCDEEWFDCDVFIGEEVNRAN